MKPTNAFSVLRRRPDIDEYRPEMPSRVLIAMSPFDAGVVLDYVGRSAAEMIEEHGITDLNLIGLGEAPRGISIWEGDWRIDGDDSTAIGRFRRLNEREWLALRDGRVLWDDTHWLRRGATKCAAPSCFEPAATPKPFCEEHWREVPHQAASEFVTALENATWAPSPADATAAAKSRVVLAFRGMR